METALIVLTGFSLGMGVGSLIGCFVFLKKAEQHTFGEFDTYYRYYKYTIVNQIVASVGLLIGLVPNGSKSGILIALSVIVVLFLVTIRRTGRMQRQREDYLSKNPD